MGLKVLLVNVHSWRNSGDGALYEVTMDIVRRAFPGCQITLAINDPDSYSGVDKKVISFYGWANQSLKQKSARFIWLFCASLFCAMIYYITGKEYTGFMPRNLKSTIHAYLEADVVIDCPGGYYFSYGRGLDFLFFSFTIGLAILLQKPIYIFPQSFGPLKYGREKWITRWIFNKSRIVMAREELSLRLLHSWGVLERKCLIMPDLALAYRNIQRDAVIHLPTCYANKWDCRRPILGVSVMDRSLQQPDFNNQKGYEMVIATAVRHFIKKYDGQALFFPQTRGPSPFEDDRPAMWRVVSLLSDVADSIVVVNEAIPVHLLWSIIGHMHMMIGTRMHANIFALSQCVPVIALAYAHKTAGIARMIGIEDWVIPMTSVTNDILIEKVDSLMKQREQVIEELVRVIPTLISEIDKIPSLISEDYATVQLGRN